MTRGIWVGLAICVASVGCSRPQFYQPPPEQLPPPANIAGTTVQIVDQRPDWEKKPFTGIVTLYHLGRAHPDAWQQLAGEVKGVVAAMPQKPARVEVLVTSYQLVLVEANSKPYRDLSAGPNPNPQLAQTPQAMSRPSPDGNDRPHGPNSATDGQGERSSSTSLDAALWFAPKDDPRRHLREHPPGSSCSIQATVRLVSPAGQVQSIDVKTFARGQNKDKYYGDATEQAVRAAVIDFSRKFRINIGMSPD